MRKLIAAFITFALIIVGIGTAAVLRTRETPDPTGDYAVSLNEIQNLIEQGETEKASACAEELRLEMRKDRTAAPDYTVEIMCGICLVFLAGVSCYCWFVMIRPFQKLSAFAERVALGDLDVPLEYERTNWFGKFTWAFDSMRREIQRARACEREAVENNKTVIASLSHDIKTPVSSIRAYTEALEMGMDGDPEKRNRYISVIMKKCDEVSKLTEDLLTHSLSDLDKLKMFPEVFELGEYLSEILDDISADRDDVRYEKPLYSVEVRADKGRTAQIAENLINNARKYAKTKIDISVTRDEYMANIIFRDHGEGIPDKDLPFVFGKFYRGSNTSGESGAGLGLFIVRYIAEQLGGEVKAKNCDKGLEVTVSLPIASKIN